MIKVLAKILLFLAVNALLLKFLYLNEVNQYAHSVSYIRQIYTGEDYKYWSKEDGRKFCGSHTDEELQKSYNELDNYSSKKTNILYLQNVDLTDCKDQLKTIATEVHRRNLGLAMNIEKEFQYRDIFNEDFTKLKDDYYRNKFKGFEFVNEWVDYLIFDHAMEYLNFNERRIVQTDLRKIFNKSFIGFRFTRHIDGFPTDKHPNRQDKTLDEFLPRDDDGDFIITSVYVPTLKRTAVYAEDAPSTLVGIRGEMIE